MDPEALLLAGLVVVLGLPVVITWALSQHFQEQKRLRGLLFRGREIKEIGLGHCYRCNQVKHLQDGRYLSDDEYAFYPEKPTRPHRYHRNAIWNDIFWHCGACIRELDEIQDFREAVS